MYRKDMGAHSFDLDEVSFVNYLLSLYLTPSVSIETATVVGAPPGTSRRKSEPPVVCNARSKCVSLGSLM